MKKFYAADMTGLLDMRLIRGPYSTVSAARAQAQKMVKAPNKARFLAAEPMFVAVNCGYCNGPFTNAARLRKDMKEAQEDTTIGGGKPSFAGKVVELVVALHQGFGDNDTVVAVFERLSG